MNNISIKVSKIYYHFEISEKKMFENSKTDVIINYHIYPLLLMVWIPVADLFQFYFLQIL